MGNAFKKCPELPVPDYGEEYEVATLGMGCFWSPEKEFRATNGVEHTVVGYTGGSELNPTYKNILDHTEAVRIVYKKKFYSFEDICEIMLNRHTPLPATSVSRQYRSVIWVANDEQRAAAERAIEKKVLLGMKAAEYVAVEDLGKFYKAEKYHQNYINKSRASPYGI